MSKQTKIVIFYSLYFSWLLSVAYLITNLFALNIYTIAIVFFYFLFLREKSDWLWFVVTIAVGTYVTGISFSDIPLEFDVSIFETLPLWLPISWGITALAIRKFYLVLIKDKDI